MIPETYMVFVQDNKGNILGKYDSGYKNTINLRSMLDELYENVAILRVNISVMLHVVVLVLA
jgi:hypothetical protein